MTDMRKTILAVDDVPDDIKIIEEILKDEYQVKAATSGEAALKIARGNPPPDLILLDVMMPGMDGFEVCRNLKEDAAGATIPVIFLTAKAMTADEKLGFELGAVDYIRKPVDPEIIRSRVKSQLEQKERTLRASEVRYRRLFETAKDGIMVVDIATDKIVDVNPALAAMLGLSQESFLGKKVSELEFLGDIWSRKTELRRKDAPLETPDGRRIFVESVRASYRANNREVTQLSIRDVTKQVEAERERDELSARLSHYLSTSPTVTYSLALKDGNAQWKWVSENIRNILGYSIEEALAKDWWFLNINASDRAGALDIISELSRHEIAHREYRFAKKNRDVVWLRDEMRLVRGSGAESEIVGTLTDISAEKKAEEEIILQNRRLESALGEKSVLLREIHHRVNNNMQVIISLLNVSSQDIDDPGVREKLEDITRRMHSMAIIHEQFYESQDMSRIDFALYLRQLLERLKAEFPRSAVDATAACATGEALVNLEQAIPAGLIVTELLTNAMKFAYPEGSAARAIRLSQRLWPDGTLEVEVRDEGVGLPPGFDPQTAPSLGMMIVRTLSKQLDGSVEFRGGSGTVATLRFPIAAHVAEGSEK
jgi:PAS domain S-box-containing protein